MKQFLGVVAFLVALNSHAQFKSILLAEEKEGRIPGGPSVIINHREQGNIIAAMGTDLIVFTTDSGRTWTESKISSPLGRGASVGMIIDAKGNIYNFHRADGDHEGSTGFDHIICQRSDDFGKTWNEGSTIGGNSGKKNDKLGIAVNIRRQILYATWTRFDKFPSEDADCQSQVMFSKATNAGNKWDKPFSVNQMPGNCSAVNSIAGATPTVAADDRIYLTWSNQGVIFFDRSYDEGKTWLFNDLPIAKQVGGWALQIPGFGVTHNTPMLKMDNSANRFHGMMYLAFADQSSGTDDTDIWMLRSARFGDNWARPVRVNLDEPGRHQFSPAMAVDQTTGTIYITYYDRRAYLDDQTDVYLAYSNDGGASFQELRISETPFVATAVPFFNHIGISAHNGVIVPVWTRTDNGKLSVWAAVIHEKDLHNK